jgi:hypothetical protein
MQGTVGEPVLLQQLQPDAGVARKRRLTVTEGHRSHEEVALIDQPGVKRRRGEYRPPTVRSRSADCFMALTESGSKRRTSRVLAVETAGNVVE